ncbi:DUF7059 domain-containing protein [Agromyces mangrovi Wang et al. 2018]|uniref:DUF7059 domain-containing protein n=1 Tax=Agromyces mangrovi TaxID=1858653 RepID=UPI0033063502|nr:hypothetical protein GCM10025877_05310 [Agromyces mangrovi]
MVTASERRIAGALARDLAAARFTVAGLDELWGDEAAAALHRGDAVPAARRLERLEPGSDPRATLARCFVLGGTAAPADLERALPAAGVDGAVELGLVEATGERITARVDLRPYAFEDRVGAAEWWIASDPGELATGAPLAEDHVLGVGGASSTLAALQWQAPVGSVLDLGTGCGIQALHAARHADRVVATDISARALRFAALNAALNDVTGIEFRLGSLFEPVAGERFDRIVSNPPFVITPRRDDVPAYEYRDGGMVGDALVAQVLGGLADHLEPGGTAQLLADWEYRGDRGRGSTARATGSRPSSSTGSSSETGSTRSSTPRRGCATAARARARPSTVRWSAPGSTTSRRAASTPSGSATSSLAARPTAWCGCAEPSSCTGRSAPVRPARTSKGASTRSTGSSATSTAPGPSSRAT